MEGFEFHVIVWNLTRQFSGQIQTVEEVYHNCKFNKKYLNIYFFNQLMFIII